MGMGVALLRKGEGYGSGMRIYDRACWSWSWNWTFLFGSFDLPCCGAGVVARRNRALELQAAQPMGRAGDP